jgi:hypothetical protein
MAPSMGAFPEFGGVGGFCAKVAVPTNKKLNVNIALKNFISIALFDKYFLIDCSSVIC